MGVRGEQRTDVLRGAAVRVQHRHALERGGSRHVEDDRVPARRVHRVREVLHDATAEVRTRVERSVHDRALDRGVVGHPVDCARREETLVHATLGPHVTPLQVERREPRVVPREALALAHALEETQLRDPLDVACALRRRAAQPREHVLPAVEDVERLGVARAERTARVTSDREQLRLDLESRATLARGEQERVVGILNRFDVLVNDLTVGLPAELAARRKQYEYYRDRLLTFEEAA